MHFVIQHPQRPHFFRIDNTTLTWLVHHSKKKKFLQALKYSGGSVRFVAQAAATLLDNCWYTTQNKLIYTFFPYGKYITYNPSRRLPRPGSQSSPSFPSSPQTDRHLPLVQQVSFRQAPRTLPCRKKHVFGTDCINMRQKCVNLRGEGELEGVVGFEGELQNLWLFVKVSGGFSSGDTTEALGNICCDMWWHQHAHKVMCT